MDRIKCTACKRMKMTVDFLKNGKTLKTCIACRDKKKEPVQTPFPVPDVPVQKLISVPEVPVQTPVPVDIPQHVEQLIEKALNRWIYLSGTWIKKGDEETLHKEQMTRLNQEFKKRSAFAVHKYLTKYLMIDIRDV